MTRETSPPVFRYEELNDGRLVRAMEESGEVHLVLDKLRGDLFAELMELEPRHDRLREEQRPKSERFRAACKAAWFVTCLSVFHGRLFEAQRLAFVLSSSRERRETPEGEILFRFVR